AVQRAGDEEDAVGGGHLAVRVPEEGQDPGWRRKATVEATTNAAAETSTRVRNSVRCSTSVIDLDAVYDLSGCSRVIVIVVG
ncbi:MAG: hypothetical protein ACYDES_14440, partial [Acidimicrobiales bacterium]